MAETMVVDGLGTIFGACFGSFYSTTVYIGHPIHKSLGAKRGFSLFNGIIYFVLYLSCSCIDLEMVTNWLDSTTWPTVLPPLTANNFLRSAGCYLDSLHLCTTRFQHVRVVLCWYSWVFSWDVKPLKRHLHVTSTSALGVSRAMPLMRDFCGRGRFFRKFNPKKQPESHPPKESITEISEMPPFPPMQPPMSIWHWVRHCCSACSHSFAIGPSWISKPTRASRWWAKVVVWCIMAGQKRMGISESFYDTRRLIISHRI